MAGFAGMTPKQELHPSSTARTTSRILIHQVRSAASSSQFSSSTCRFTDDNLLWWLFLVVAFRSSFITLKAFSKKNKSPNQDNTYYITKVKALQNHKRYYVTDFAGWGELFMINDCSSCINLLHLLAWIFLSEKSKDYTSHYAHTECKYQLQQMAMKQKSSVLSINTGFVMFSVLNVY